MTRTQTGTACELAPRSPTLRVTADRQPSAKPGATASSSPSTAMRIKASSRIAAGANFGRHIPNPTETTSKAAGESIAGNTPTPSNCRSEPKRLARIPPKTIATQTNLGRIKIRMTMHTANPSIQAGSGIRPSRTQAVAAMNPAVKKTTRLQFVASAAKTQAPRPQNSQNP